MNNRASKDFRLVFFKILILIFFTDLLIGYGVSKVVSPVSTVVSHGYASPTLGLSLFFLIFVLACIQKY